MADNLGNTSRNPVKEFAWYSQFSSPFGRGENGSFPFNFFIICLACICGPPAITGFIISIGLNSVKGHIFGPLTHVFKKVFKIFPSFANIYSPSTISMITVMIWIIAPLTHTFPRCISTCSFIINRVTMFCRGLFMKASARALRHIFSLHTVIVNIFNSSAIAFAFPHRFAGSSIITPTENKKPAVFFSGSVNKLTHTFNIANNLVFRNNKGEYCERQFYC